jgi:hypothetical protein
MTLLGPTLSGSGQRRFTFPDETGLAQEMKAYLKEIRVGVGDMQKMCEINA